MLLFIGLDSDLHLDAAVIECRTRNLKFIRINPLRLTTSNTSFNIDLSNGNAILQMHTYAGILDSSTITGVWCRYSIESMDVTETENQFSSFTQNEFITLLKGIFSSIPHSYWLNDPYFEAKADNKPYQLYLANLFNLPFPPTTFTQSKENIRKFVSKHGDCVIKAASDSPLIMEQSGNLVGNFAAHLDVSLIEGEDWDQNCPVFIQKLIKKSADIRITVVGENVYGARLLQSDNNEQYIDFRQSDNLKTSPYDVPSDTSTKLKKVLKHLGLRFASCDFCLECGNLYFLEANVTGNYLWVEMEALLPITRSVINLLSE